jgi:hypothetical protein
MSEIVWAPRIVGAPKLLWFTLYDTQGGDSYEVGAQTTWSDGSTRELYLTIDALAGFEGKPGRPPFMHPFAALSFTPGERGQLYTWACRELHVVIAASGFTPQNPLQRAVTYYAQGCEPARGE